MADSSPTCHGHAQELSIRRLAASKTSSSFSSTSQLIMAVDSFLTIQSSCYLGSNVFSSNIFFLRERFRLVQIGPRRPGVWAPFNFAYLLSLDFYRVFQLRVARGLEYLWKLIVLGDLRNSGLSVAMKFMNGIWHFTPHVSADFQRGFMIAKRVCRIRIKKVDAQKLSRKKKREADGDAKEIEFSTS